MQDERSIEPNLKSLFIGSLEFNDLEQRRKYLDDTCGDNAQLRGDVERLLMAHDTTGVGRIDRLERWLEPFRLDVDLDAETTATPSIETLQSIGPYELLRPIGEGGMGTVYLARQSHPVCREVALKLIKPGMDSREVLARFEAEMQTLGMMQHPNISSVLDAGLTAQGRPYFVMELVRGLAIDKHCAAVSASLNDRLGLFMSVCRAVQHAHNRGVIHRDLKPSNILVLVQDGLPAVKVIDFGIAKAITSDVDDQTRLTQFKQLLGTPLYMSPEQVREDGPQIDLRSDIYSLGVLLYELVAGAPPVDRKMLRAASSDRIRRIICEDTPLRPSQLAKSNIHAGKLALGDAKIGRELDWIILRALEKEPQRRYQSATELADDLQRFLNGEAVRARPPSMAYRLQKSLRRHAWTATIATAFLVTCLAAGGVSLMLYWDARNERRISQLRDQQAHELHVANVLQSALRAMASGDLSAMSDNLQSLGGVPPDDSGSAHRRSLVRLLAPIANPLPLASYVHGAPIRGVAVSSNTNTGFAVDEAGRILVFDLSLDALPWVLGQHTERADSIAVAPDGKRLVSGSSTGQVWLWDVETKALVRQLASLPSGVQTLVWSPDGKTIAAGGRYSEFVVYDSSGEELFRQANDHRHESMLFSHDGQQLIVPTREHLAVWDVASGKLAKTIATDRISNVRSICWAGPEGRWLIAGERFSEGIVAIDVDSGKALGSFNVGAEYACSMAGSSDARSLVATYSNGRAQLIRLSDRRSGAVEGHVELKFAANGYAEDENAPMAVRWIAGGHFLTAGADGAINVWDAKQLPSATVLQPPRELIGINWVSGRRLARYFYGDNYFDQPRRRPQAAELDKPDPEAGSFVPQVFDYAAVDKRIAAAGEHRIGILNTETQHWLACFPSPLASHHFVALSKDAKCLAASSDSQLHVWRTDDDWETQQLVQSWSFSTSIKPQFSVDMKSLFVDEYEEGQLLELEISSGRELRRFPGGNQGNCAQDGSGQFLATATEHGFCVWDLKDSSVVFEVDDLSQPLGFEFLEEENVLISGHLSGEVRAWHVATRQPLGSLYKPSKWLGRPVGFQLSPDGTGLLIRYRNPAHIHPVILGSADFGRR